MSRNFNCARAEIVAKREGISWLAAARRIGALGGRRTQEKRRLAEYKAQALARCWWRREEA